MTTSPPPDLAAFRDRATDAGVLLDFDGTLAEIVERPELAAAADGVGDALVALVDRYRLVGILTGRRADEIEDRLGATPGLRVFGLYGLEGTVPMHLPASTIDAAHRAASSVVGAWVEDKGGSLAVHYRQAVDPDLARLRLLEALPRVAATAALEIIEGKMVIELVPPGRPLKGGAIERLTGEHGLRALLYAGDDLADLDAFAALDRLRLGGAVTIKVAVRGTETPAELIAGADLVADRPGGLVALLRTLV